MKTNDSDGPRLQEDARGGRCRINEMCGACIRTIGGIPNGHGTSQLATSSKPENKVIRARMAPGELFTDSSCPVLGTIGARLISGGVGWVDNVMRGADSVAAAAAAAGSH